MTDSDTDVARQDALSARLLRHITGSWTAQALHVAAELRLADLLAEGPKTADDLAALTNTHAPSLLRLLRALTTIDVCTERADGLFEITAMGALLKDDCPDSLRSWTIWWGTSLWQVWANLLYSVRTGKSARTLLTGTEGFDHLEHSPADAAVFNQALVELTKLSARSVVQLYDFSGVKRIVDVGGGYGELLLAILKANPGITGVLFDRPHTASGATQHIRSNGLQERCSFVEGDFFKSVPDGADLYLLKSVLHDWDDDRCKIILDNCRSSMSEKGRILIVELVLPDRLDQSLAHQAAVESDLTMLAALQAQERSETGFRRLLDSAGLRLKEIVPLSSGSSIIEAVRG